MISYVAEQFEILVSVKAFCRSFILTMTRSTRGGFSLVELLVVLAVIGVLVALLLPAVQQARETSRRMACTNNMKQLGIALHVYHDTHLVFPYREGGYGRHQHNGGTIAPYQRLSGFVALLPYLEQNAIANEVQSNGQSKTPWDDWQPWQTSFSSLLCPSSPPHMSNDAIADSNYTFCAGDSTDTESLDPRGIFGLVKHTKISDITDGTSNTLALSEHGLPTSSRDIFNVNYGSDPATPAECALTFDPFSGYEHAVSAPGSRWTDGGSAFSAMNTCLPPNRPQCAFANHDAQDGFYTASSYHPGGVMATFADGSVRFITETIDAGNQGAEPVASGPSPYGVWGSMGSKSGGEYTPGSE